MLFLLSFKFKLAINSKVILVLNPQHARETVAQENRCVHCDVHSVREVGSLLLDNRELVSVAQEGRLSNLKTFLNSVDLQEV